MIRVAVIGLGRVGCGEAGEPPRSHIAAVLAVKGMTLAAGVDSSSHARAAARKIWNLPASIPILADANELAAGSADVIVVAAPTSLRLQTVVAALQKKPKILIVEKPLAASLGEGTEIVERAREQGVALRVNFHRRFDPGHRAFRAALTSDPRHVVVRYGKGVFNYASHMVDLLIDWFGQVESVEALAGGKTTGDPNISFRLHMSRGFDALFIGMDGLDYDQFEAEFYLPDQKLELASGGVEKRRARAMPDRFHKGYVQLGPAEDVSPPGPVGGFRELYESIRAHLEEGEPLAGCGADDALHGLVVLEAALASARGGKSVAIGGETRAAVRSKR